MKTIDFEFEGNIYSCRIVKDNNGKDLIIGSTDFLDILQPGSFEDENEGFSNTEASDIYNEIFYFTDAQALRLNDTELIALLREGNPDWF